MRSPNEEKELSFTPAYRLAEMIRRKKLSPEELMEVTLKRIEAINPRLNAYLTVTGEEVMQAAREAEKALGSGAAPGPLHGIPVSIKDLIVTKDIRTTQGSLVYRDLVPQTEGTMVQRLKAAGAIVIGKTNTPEFGFCCCTENKLGDACRNPWDTARNSGGSSGGAAAGTAAGISPLAQGSDGGGSTRIPASWCGVYGLKASYGRVPKDVQPWGVSQVACWDPMTRNVRDAALMLTVMAGPDGLDYSCIRTAPPDFVRALEGRTRKLKIAWSRNLGYDVKVDPAVSAALEEAVKLFSEMGHEVDEDEPATGEPFELWDVLFASRGAVYLGPLLDKHADELTDYVRLALECARGLSGIEVAKAWAQVERLQGTMLDFFHKYDLLLTPTTAVTAPPVGQRGRGRGRGFMDWDFAPFTCVFNMSGNPAASVPNGFSAEGLPIGLQMVGRYGDEITVLQASAAFEEAKPWAGKLPPVS
jgi:Asp-tRNA(Asn)/Glu-tRNA(Gln) amidotransferase A subunit family amidase